MAEEIEVQQPVESGEPTGTETPEKPVNEAGGAGDPEEQDAGQEGDGDGEGEGDEGGHKPKKNNFQKRIDKMRDKFRLEAELEVERFQRQFYERQLQPQPEPQDNGRPKKEEYADSAEFAEALSDWTLAEVERKQAATTMQSQAQQQRAAINNKIAEASKKYSDFEDVAFSPEAVAVIKPNPEMGAEIFEAKNYAEVAYFLGENLDEASRIAALPEKEMIREIARLDEKIGGKASAAPATPKKPTGAPPPPKMVGGSGGATVDRSKLPIDDWMKLRNAEIQGR